MIRIAGQVLRGSAAVILAATTAGAQDPPPIRVESVVALIDLVVSDGNGAFVDDVRPEEIMLLEDGKPRPVSFFELVRPHRRVSLEADPASVEGEPHMSPGPAASFSRVVPVVIFVDLESMDVTGFRQTKETIRTFVSRRVDPEDRVMVVANKNGLRILGPFTADPVEIASALSDLPQPKPILSYRGLIDDIVRIYRGASGCPQCDPLAEAVGKARTWLQDLESRVRSTQRSLMTLAAHLRQIPGRKQLVFFSGGYPLVGTAEVLDIVDDYSFLHPPSRARLVSRPSDSIQAILGAKMGTASDDIVRKGLREAIAGLNDSQIAAYTVDPRGLMAMDIARSDFGSISPGAMQRHARRNVRSPMEFSMELAEKTGGIAVRETNELGRGLSLSHDDSHSYYLVGYEPADVEFRESSSIEIGINRRGLRLRYRARSFPEPNVAADQLLQTAFKFPGLHQDFPLSVVVEDDGTTAVVRVEIPTNALVFQPTGEHFLCTLELYGALLDSSGGWVGGGYAFFLQFPLRQNRQQLEELLKKRHVAANANFESPRGEFRLVVVARQVPSGRISSHGFRLVGRK